MEPGAWVGLRGVRALSPALASEATPCRQGTHRDEATDALPGLGLFFGHPHRLISSWVWCRRRAQSFREARAIARHGAAWRSRLQACHDWRADRVRLHAADRSGLARELPARPAFLLLTPATSAITGIVSPPATRWREARSSSRLGTSWLTASALPGVRRLRPASPPGPAVSGGTEQHER